jgi:hypothetical protein
MEVQSALYATSKAEEVRTSFRTIKSFDNKLYKVNNYCKSLNKINLVFKSISFAEGMKDATSIKSIIAVLLYCGLWFIVSHQDCRYNSDNMMMKYSKFCRHLLMSMKLNVIQYWKYMTK